MSFLRKGAIVGVVALLCLSLAPVASAQLQKEKALFSVSESLEIGSHTLPPGTYQIEVVQLAFNRNLIKVTDRDGTKVFATALATPHPIKEDEMIPDSRFVYFPSVAGQTKVLRTWYGPDKAYGQDIIYTKKRSVELAARAETNLIAIPEETKETEYKTVPYTTVTREGTEVAYVEPKAPATSTYVASTPPESLPRTASSVPLTALLGVAAVGSALALRRTR